MYKLIIIILALGQPIGEIRTDKKFDTERACHKETASNWKFLTKDKRMTYRLDCRIEI